MRCQVYNKNIIAVLTTHKRNKAGESDCLVRFSLCFTSLFSITFLISLGLIGFHFSLACSNYFQCAEETLHASQSRTTGA